MVPILGYHVILGVGNDCASFTQYETIMMELYVWVGLWRRGRRKSEDDQKVIT